MSASATDTDLELIRDIVQRVVDDLAMITDREFLVEDVSALRDDKKTAGKSKIHISFRLGFHLDGQVLHGCILLPLPAAISLACYLMMVGMALIVLPQWQRNERLPFPLLRFQQSLIEDPDKGRFLPPLFRNLH